LSLNAAQWIARNFGRPDVVQLAPDDVAAVAALVREDHYPAGATLFRMGSAPVRVGIVRRGAVELSRRLNGRRVVLQILRPGDAVGDLGVFLRMTAPYDGVALDDTTILSIDSVQFHRLLEEHPRLARRWTAAICCRLLSYQERLLEVLAGGLEAQITSVLVRRAEGGVVNLSQSNIAELVGGSRSRVNRVLKRLEEERLVRVGYGHIEIVDEAGLARVAGLA
jgi:CRP-like cAMP-binding protein